MKFRYHRSQDVEPDIAPINLIDTMLVLLLFFMSTTTFDQYRALKIKLPEAETQAKESRQDRLEVIIDGAGNYVVAKQALADNRLETLRAVLAQQAAGDPSQPLIISADASTPYQAVIKAMDAASQVGLVNISFATELPLSAGG